MNKTTQEQKDKMNLLKSEGKSEQEISDLLGLKIHKVRYWTNPELRKRHIQGSLKYFSKKSLEEKRKYYKSRNEYLKAYFKKRYKEDPIFREKQKERCRRLKGGNKQWKEQTESI